MADTGDSGDFVFTRGGDGALQYKGDFEGLYRDMHDPWGQSGEHPRMADYYAYSRAELVNTLVELSPERMLEIGCGTGHVVDYVRRHLLHCAVHGCDISHTAIERAWSLHPMGFFFRLDITAPVEPYHFYCDHYDVVVLSQILWYVLDKLPDVFDNCSKLLVPGGHLIIQTAFLDRQEYGRDIVDGWHALLHWVLTDEGNQLATQPRWRIVGASYDASDRHAPHHDGILVLQKAAPEVQP
jgi:SAM-dependent methyltransferase